MADPRARRSALAPLYREGRWGAAWGEPGAILAERRPLAIVQIWAWDGAGEGLGLPPPGRSSDADGAAFLWIGPGRWLAVARDEAGGDLAATLGERFGAAASLTDIGHARVAIRISGPRTRDLLAKGTGIDLHPRAFAGGACAGTLVGHVAALLLAVADDAIDVYVARSYALDFWEWLTDAAAEFGYVVAGPDQPSSFTWTSSPTTRTG
jgi:sarcosine oxidase subunit gamma